MSYIDFAEVKQNHTIESVVRRLDLEVKKSGHGLRGPCPACESDNDRNLSITPGKNVWYCFAAQEGGDCISLVAHVLGLSAKQAAAWIVGDTAPAKQEKQTEPKERSGFKPLDYLESDHPAVEAVGFSAEDASKIGAGYAPRGIMRGTVCVPVRDETGKLLGYVGITEAKLPNAWSF